MPLAGNAELLRWMFSFTRPVKGLIVLACLWLSLWVGTEVLATRASGEAITQIQKVQISRAAVPAFSKWIMGAEGGAGDLRRVVYMLTLLILATVVLRYLKEVSNMKMSMEMVYYIREAVYDKLQRVGFAFHDTISTGQLINRALTDLQNVRAFVNSAVLLTLEIGLVVGGYILLLMTRSTWVAVLSLVPLPLWTWYILRFSKKVQPAIQAVMTADDKNVSIITENIAGVHVVKAFATQGHETDKYNAHADYFLDRVLFRIRMFANFAPFMRLIAISSNLSLFMLASIFILLGKLQAGDIIILGGAMNAILGRLQQVSVINEQYQSAIVSARRLHEVLSARPTVPVKESARPLPEGPGGVTFDHVTFGYDPSRPVLKDVSFSVPGGQIVAIVGPTGAGKSTMVQLLGRFYDPQEGRILVDGVDIADVALDSIRTQVAYVFQETYLFSDTVEANIAYGRPHILNSKVLSEDGSPDSESLAMASGEVEAASRLAQAHEFVEQLPKGYQTMLGERGSSLSGGQKQRLAIARAIISNPRILVLDDATAAIDSQTEEMIRKGMKFVMRGRTTFVIAHRISTVKQADLVLVIENGQITQSGTHNQLMEQRGHYQQIAAAQLYGDIEVEDQPSHMKRVQREVAKAEVAAGSRERGQTGENG